MLTLQDRMNTKVHPQWIEQRYEWFRAIWIECGELMEHYGYKWWKKQTPDIEQVRLEAIDIWHFGLSALYGTQRPESDIPGLQRILGYVYENSRKFYNFKGLHFFKEKYHPQWQPRYVVYPSNAALPGVFMALLKAFQG